MKEEQYHYSLTTSVWQYPGKAAWHFITLPPYISADIRASFRHEEAAWGRLPVTAAIGNFQWQTALWFDIKSNAYLLPLKKTVRVTLQIIKGDIIHVKPKLCIRSVRRKRTICITWVNPDLVNHLEGATK